MKHNIELWAELKHVRENCDVKINDLEQYGRKNMMRIEGIELSDDESPTQLTKKVTDTLNSMGAEVTAEDFFRLHRSGRAHMKNGRRVAQSIVRFKSSKRDILGRRRRGRSAPNLSGLT